MQGFNNLTQSIRAHFEGDPLVNTVTEGNIFDVDLNKQTIFPLVHLMVNNASFEGSVIRFNVSLIAMDVVDMSKDETIDIFRGNSNEQDVLDTQLRVLNRAYELMRRGGLWDNSIVVGSVGNCEPFTERFENLLAGWTMTIDIDIPNDMTICTN